MTGATSEVRDWLAFTNEGWAKLASLDGRKRKKTVVTRDGKRVASWKLRSMEVLERFGTRFTGVREATDDEAGVVRHCYSNAWEWVKYRRRFSREKGWRYYEGLAAGSVIPLTHAWAVNVETGEVLDNTWCPKNGVKLGTDYVGIEVPMDVVEWLMDEHDTCGVLDSWWMLPDKLRSRVLRRNTRKVRARRVDNPLPK